MKRDHFLRNQPLIEVLHLILQVFQDDIMFYIPNHYNFIKKVKAVFNSIYKPVEIFR